MLRFIYADDLDRTPVLQDTMFRDRAKQFHDRLGWAVTVDDKGHERDEYDDENPLYVIWQRPSGEHGGSLRLLPTTGRTMVHDHFLHLTENATIKSPFIWECTRFCLAPEAGGKIAAALMLGGGAFMQAYHIKHFLGVFDGAMIRIYRATGASPDLLGSHGAGRAMIGVGLWHHSLAAQARLSRSSGLSPALVRRWLDRSLGHLDHKLEMTA